MLPEMRRPKFTVWMDNSSANRALVQKDAVQAFMAQNPHEMGKQAMKAAVRMLDRRESWR